MCHPRRPAGFLEQQGDVGHRLFRLAGRVADGQALPGVQVLGDLATQVDRVAGDHRLAEVVVQVLLGIGFLGIELADPGVCHHALFHFAS